MITRNGFPFAYQVYDPSLPPPLCFTPGQPAAPAQQMARGGSVAVKLSAPHVMADPSDPTTWQRPYRFTT